MADTTNKLLVIDAHAVIHRAFHALPPMESAVGVPTNALFGFFTILHNTIEYIKPTHLVICFDTPVKTFRKDLMESYQHKRPHLDDGLRVQITLIKDAIDASGMVRLEKEGFEADDVIGTVTRHAETAGFTSYILTGDKDIFQLVSDRVFVLMPNGGYPKLYNALAVLDKMGVPPHQITDYKALVGDSSDNYGGVHGIGPKTAISILKAYETVEDIFLDPSKIPTERAKNLILESKEHALLTKQIATILRDVEVNIDFPSLLFHVYPQPLLDYLHTHDIHGLDKKFLHHNDKKVAQKKKEEQEKPQPPDDGQLGMF